MIILSLSIRSDTSELELTAQRAICRRAYLITGTKYQFLTPSTAKRTNRILSLCHLPGSHVNVIIPCWTTLKVLNCYVTIQIGIVSAYSPPFSEKPHSRARGVQLIITCVRTLSPSSTTNINADMAAPVKDVLLVGLGAVGAICMQSRYTMCAPYDLWFIRLFDPQTKWTCPCNCSRKEQL